MHKFLKFVLGMKLYMFRTVSLSIIRSFSLYTQQWCMSYRFADSLQAGSSWTCLQAVGKPVRHTPLLCVQWKTPDDGQRNCSKHVEFHSKNKFEKLVHLIGFIIRNLVDYSRKNVSICVLLQSTFHCSRTGDRCNVSFCSKVASGQRRAVRFVALSWGSHPCLSVVLVLF